MSVLKGKIHITLVIALLTCSNFNIAQTPATPEYQVKAVFLFNFTHFINWPPSSFSSDQAPFVIGIFGNNPFGSYLNEVVSVEKVNGHPIVVNYYKNIEDIKTCHILFVNKTDINRINEFQTFNDRNTLTVSDSPDFMQKGGMIRFFTRNNKIQLQINLDAVKSAKLDVSSKLLRLAEIYVSR
jgi:hypothetical protein